MRARDVQVVEQAFALRHVMRRGDRLGTGLAAFAPVEQDASERRRQVVKQFDLLIHAERRPRLDHRVEGAQRIINSGGPEPTTS